MQQNDGPAKRGVNRRILLAERPEGALAMHHFRADTMPVPEPAAGQALVAVRLISIDAANRAWMQGQTYRTALAGGAVMAGLAIGEVVSSRTDRLTAGDLVFGDLGWQDYALVDPADVTVQRSDIPTTHLLSLYGTSTLTAAIGLMRIGDVARGDTVVVSAAGGSVGVMAGQIAKAEGARVVGIAGGAEKCAWLVEEMGFDAAVDHRDPGFGAALRRALPGGIDLYFDNVGGEVLDRCLFAMNERGRIVCCGAVASYDGDKPRAGPRGVPGLLVTRRLTMRGFVVSDFDAERDAWLARIDAWAAAGLIRPVEDVVDGLDGAPRALIDQLAGRSRGKKMVRL